jgi:hypothetical protein
MSSKNQIEECCPEFNPVKWDKKIFNWNEKQFILLPFNKSTILS